VATRAACRLCGETRSTRRYAGLVDVKYHSTEDAFDIVECAGCGLWYSLRNGEHYDPSPYYLEEYNPYTRDRSILPKTDLLERTLPHVARTRASWIRHVDTSSVHSILDVGCGTGRFYEAYRAIADEVFGIEMSPEAAAVAERKGMHLHVGTLDSYDEARTFDVVTLIHVLEHLADPLADLSKVRRLLRPDGTLVIGTPNVDSIERKLFGRHWDNWDTPRHLALYDARSLPRLLERTGFRVEHVLHEENCIMDRSLGNLLASRGRPERRLPKAALKLFARAFAIAASSTSLLAIARRAD